MLQYYIALKRELGIYIIVTILLMNYTRSILNIRL